jgi:hypothetical protein
MAVHCDKAPLVRAGAGHGPSPCWRGQPPLPCRAVPTYRDSGQGADGGEGVHGVALGRFANRDDGSMAVQCHETPSFSVGEGNGPQGQGEGNHRIMASQCTNYQLPITNYQSPPPA